MDDSPKQISHHLLTPEQMARADALTIEGGTSGFDLMQAAGRGVAKAAVKVLELEAAASPDHTPEVIVMCGPGNNGGDGFIAAHWLRQQGYRVRVHLLGSRTKLSGDAALAARQWGDPIETFETVTVTRPGVLVDAIFGAGLSKPIAGALADLVDRINSSGVPVVAVDLPSGICGASGRVLGRAFKAARTVTFFCKKPGHLLLPGRVHCGEVMVCDIGIGAGVLADIAVDTFANTRDLWQPAFPQRDLNDHKYRRGHGLVMSGPMAATGAARLAARAALRVGAGLVTLLSSGQALQVNAAHLTAVMLERVDGPDMLGAALADPRRNAILLGPAMGLGAATRTCVQIALDRGKAVVLDADALTSFGGEAEPLAAAVKASSGPVVITPHAGEFARLYPDIAENTNTGKLEQARAAAERLGAIVVRKGADTVIAEPAGRAAINSNAPPWLATAGSGDVLAGIILGLLTQSMPAFEAACAGVWLHGAAASQAGAGMIAEDLDSSLHMALRGLLGPASD